MPPWRARGNLCSARLEGSLRRIKARHWASNASRPPGITQAEWRGVYWARWGDAVRDAGYEPGTWQGKKLDDDALVRVLADATRELGHFPTTAELRLAGRGNPDMPNDKVFRSRIGSKAEQVGKVLAFARSHADYTDVATICDSLVPSSPRVMKPAAEPSVVTGVVYLIQMGEFHKIGKSNDVGRRSYELGIQLPEKHDVVHVIETDDPSGIEAYWHRRFAANRANGEWFRLAPGDVAAFKRRTYM